ncbi:MAG: T9SS type A sorting domain-containing protein [Gemmatimonadetes bacterium]|nr:T9SS type A sorting domain-containing protein [Gemmatimonadota bacterium]
MKFGTAGLASALIALSLLAPRAFAAASDVDDSPFAAFDEIAAWYESHPELATQPGSGWKPYQRIKWFVEQRMYEGKLPEPGARWKVWEERMRRAEVRGRGASTWFSLGPANFSGRMLSIAFDPTNASIVYAGAAGGGLWKSTDGGLAWTPITDELPSIAIGGVAVSPTNPSIVVIGTGEGTPNIDQIGGVGILRSTDAGATWGTTNVTFAVNSGHGFHSVDAGPNGTLLAGAVNALYRSTDNGATWATVQSGGNWYDAKWKPGASSTVYAVRGSCGCSQAGVHVSTDDGATWTRVGTGQPSGTSIGKSKIAVTAANPDRVYAMFVNRSTSNLLGVYRSDNGGTNWSLTANTPNIPGGQGWYNLSLVADPDNANTVIAGGVDLFRSTDAGVTFGGTGGISVHVDHHLAAYEPGSNSNVWVGSDGGLWRSGNDGVAFSDRNDGLVTYQFYDICVNNGPTPYFVMGGTQDQGTDKWSGTTTWSEGLFADGMVCNINPGNGNVVYAEIQGGQHYKNTNAGSGGGWTAINNGISGSGAWVTPVAEDQTVGNHLYTSTTAGIFRTLNGGTLWTNVASHGANWIDISPVDGNIVWTVGGTTRVSTNDGASWTQRTYGFSTGTPTKVQAHPTDPNSAVVTFSSYANVAHVAYTTNLGATWTDATGDLPDQPVNAIAIDPDFTDEWYIGTDVGVWKSTNLGVNWVPFGEDLPNTVVADLEIRRADRKLVAGTHGRGAWEADLPPTGGTGVEPGVDIASSRILLDAPWPNPARDRTLLRFAARGSDPVHVEIYDVQGRLVSDLASFPTGDGIIRTTPWFPDDVPAGVYFAVLRAGEERVSRKIVVAR